MKNIIDKLLAILVGAATLLILFCLIYAVYKIVTFVMGTPDIFMPITLVVISLLSCYYIGSAAIDLFRE